jgi:ubiquinone/menaquinone biosynthesis C-methylase UbiE
MVKKGSAVNLKKWQEVWRRFSGKGIYPHELAFILDNPLRNLILPAKQLVDRLHLSKNSRVLEIGPGPGFFSSEVIKRIPEGELILIDIQWEMLAKSRAKLRRTGLKNFWLVQGNAQQLPFGMSTFDIVFLVTVMGEVANPEICMASIVKILRQGGVLSLTEQAGDPDALTEDELQLMGEAKGLSYMEVNRFRGGFTLNLMKVRNHGACV